MELVLILILIGLATGVLAGLLGIGGGIITVPALYYVFIYFEFPKAQIMHLAIATALASTLLTSLGSTWSHQKRGAILYSALKFIAPGLILGCVGGALLAHLLSNRSLETIFGIMAILFGIYFFFPHLPQLHLGNKPNPSLIAWGLAIGCLSTLLGVGGGLFMVPILLGYALSLQQAVATSSAGTLVTALIGTLFYLFLGWNQLPSPSVLGYIYLPGFLAIGLSSLLTTSWGVYLAHTLRTGCVKRIFACMLAATGIAMLLGI